MKQTNVQVISKLNDEFTSLSSKLNKLEIFMTTSDFQELDFRQKDLLDDQRKAMVMYKDILLLRLQHLRELEDLKSKSRDTCEEGEKDE